jgi:hypothetical protein
MDVWSPTTPTEHACSLGRFNYGMNKEHKEEVISWANEDIWL